VTRIEVNLDVGFELKDTGRPFLLNSSAICWDTRQTKEEKAQHKTYLSLPYPHHGLTRRMLRQLGQTRKEKEARKKEKMYIKAKSAEHIEEMA